MALQLLKDKNGHIRDKSIVFYETGHKYLVNGKSGYRSVTTLVKNAFEKFSADKIIDNMMKSKNWPNSKYYGMTKTEIKKSWNDNKNTAATTGTNMHEMIEFYYNGIHLDKINEHKDTIEYIYFMNFVNDNSDIVPYRTEWCVYHEEYKISGSIDFVGINPDGTLSFLDWKRSKKIEKYSNFNKKSIIEGLEHIPDTNYWHYILQLNLYKFIVESKYGFKVKDLHLVVIHPENELQNYEKIKVPIISEIDIKKLIAG